MKKIAVAIAAIAIAALATSCEDRPVGYYTVPVYQSDVDKASEIINAPQ